MVEKSVLFVDDEEAILDMYSLVFQREGYGVLTAREPAQALSLLETASPGVMFLDLNLPEMTGIELCRIIRQFMPWPVILAVTGYVGLYGVSECKSAGFDGFFTKPIAMSRLLQAAALVFQKRAEDEWPQRV